MEQFHCARGVSHKRNRSELAREELGREFGHAVDGLDPGRD